MEETGLERGLNQWRAKVQTMDLLRSTPDLRKPIVNPVAFLGKRAKGEEKGGQ